MGWQAISELNAMIESRDKKIDDLEIKIGSLMEIIKRQTIEIDQDNDFIDQLKTQVEDLADLFKP